MTVAPTLAASQKAASLTLATDTYRPTAFCLPLLSDKAVLENQLLPWVHFCSSQCGVQLFVSL